LNRQAAKDLPAAPAHGQPAKTPDGEYPPQVTDAAQAGHPVDGHAQASPVSAPAGSGTSDGAAVEQPVAAPGVENPSDGPSPDAGAPPISLGAAVDEVVAEANVSAEDGLISA
jgi:hypothetical protein